MSEFMFQIEGVMRSEIKSLDALADNAANAMTPGFRSRYQAAGGADFSGLLQGAAADPQHHVSNRDGPLQVTGARTDLALRGDAWFAVETDDGLRLTRDGRFQISDDGSLVDRAGNAVAWEERPAAALDSDMSVMADGTVVVSGKSMGRLRIVALDKGTQVTPDGAGLYRVSGELKPAEAAAVVQGVYEESNVDTAADVMAIMRSVRHVETLQRSISAYDKAIGIGINQLGK